MHADMKSTETFHEKHLMFTPVTQSVPITSRTSLTCIAIHRSRALPMSCKRVCVRDFSLTYQDPAVYIGKHNLKQTGKTFIAET